MSHVVSLDRFFGDEIRARLKRDSARRSQLSVSSMPASDVEARSA